MRLHSNCAEGVQFNQEGKILFIACFSYKWQIISSGLFFLLVLSLLPRLPRRIAAFWRLAVLPRVVSFWQGVFHLLQKEHAVALFGMRLLGDVV